MKFILIGVVGLTAVVLLEALVYTMRYLGDRRKDELKRRLSALGSGGAGPQMTRACCAWASWPSTRPSTRCCARSSVSARLETLLEQTELEMTVAQLLAYMGIAAIAGLHARGARLGRHHVHRSCRCCSA